MKAFVLPHAGSESVKAAEVPQPTPSGDELLVQVHAIGVGIHDSYFLPSDADYPYPIGIEAAGVVHSVGASVSGFAPGDRIAFVSSMQPKGGTWAEYVAVKANSLIIPLPGGFDFVKAATLPVAGNTILKAFRSLDTPAPESTLFIAGGSGAIGTLAIQLARRAGWRVAASASPSNHEFMRSLGAECVVDYNDERWPEQVREWAAGGVTAAIAIPPGTAAPSLAVVHDGGQLIAISGDDITTERGVRYGGVPYQFDVRDELAQLMTDVARGDLHLEIENVYPFENALDALAKVQTRRARGKSVIQLIS